MCIDFYAFDSVPEEVDSALRSIASRSTRHAALLLLVGRSPLRRRALPGAPITTHSAAANYSF